MNRTVIRASLLVAYFLLSLEVSLIFIRSDGEGSYVPLAFLFSWGILPEQCGWVSKPIGFWIVPALYLVCMFCAVTFCARSQRLMYSLSPLVIHGLGVLIALWVVKRIPEHGQDATNGFLIASYVTSLVLASAHLLSDWQLARKHGKVPMIHDFASEDRT